MSVQKSLSLVLLAWILFLCCGCDLFQVSLADYLEQSPAELRLSDVWIEYNGGQYRPEEAIRDQNHFTIFVTPFSLDDSGTQINLKALPENPSSKVVVEAPNWYSSGRALNAQTVFNLSLQPAYKNFNSYRKDTQKTIKVSFNGITKSYTVRIIWAVPINHPSEITVDQDYYLKPGPAITLDNWTPIGRPFRGSVRGNGRTIKISGFSTAPSEGLFGELDRAVIEDLTIILDDSGGPARANGANIGALAGKATESLIQRIRVSGALYNNYEWGADNNVGGIVGSLDSKAAVYNCISTINIEAKSSRALANFFVGGIAGKVQTAGGLIINCYAAGNIAADTPASLGGIAGGGGASAGLTDVNGCVSFSPVLHAQASGRVARILAQWDDPSTAALNYFQSDLSLSISGTSSALNINGTGKTLNELKQQSVYTGLGWDFNAVWNMGSDGFPALR
jgi:hypothetical protein